MYVVNLQGVKKMNTKTMVKKYEAKGYTMQDLQGNWEAHREYGVRYNEWLSMMKGIVDQIPPKTSKIVMPAEIEKNRQTDARYAAAVQKLLDDGMPVEELQIRMKRYSYMHPAEQAKILEIMAIYRRTGDLVPLEKVRLTN